MGRIDNVMVRLIEFIKDTFKYMIIIAVIILLRVYVLTTAEVVGDSMEPFLHNGNMMLVEMVTPRLDRYKRFEIVVIKYDNPSYLIKRVIGLPGENIKYEDNKLYINDVLIKEDLKLNGETEDLEIDIPDNMFYVLGDNRGDSKDSRVIGPIPETDVIGKPFSVIWPFKEFKTTK